MRHGVHPIPLRVIIYKGDKIVFSLKKCILRGKHYFLSPLWMITLEGIRHKSEVLSYLYGVEKENGVANRQKDKNTQLR